MSPFEWIVAEEARPLYHAALVVGANHLVTLVNDAADLLRRAGVDRPAAVLGPLVNPFDGRDAGDHAIAAWARAGWDDAALYLAVIVRDRAPSSPFQRDAIDPHVWGASSGVELMLQPGDPGDNRDYYELQIDVQGAIFDTHWDDYNTPIAGTGDTKSFGHMQWTSKMERAVFLLQRLDCGEIVQVHI